MLVCEKPLALAFASFTVTMICGIEARPGIPTVLSQLEFPSTGTESSANSSCQPILLPPWLGAAGLREHLNTVEPSLNKFASECSLLVQIWFFLINPLRHTSFSPDFMYNSSIVII